MELKSQPFLMKNKRLLLPLKSNRVNERKCQRWIPYKAEWDSTQEILETRPPLLKSVQNLSLHVLDGPGVFESVLNKYNLTGDYVAKQFQIRRIWKLMHGWMLVMTTIWQNGSSVSTGMVRNKPSPNPVVSDKIQAPAVDYLKNHFCSCSKTTLQMNSLWELTWNHPLH